MKKEATADPENAEAIAQDAGMRLRKVAEIYKATLALENGAVSGLLLLIAKAVERAMAYAWQCRLDGSDTWIDLPATTKSRTTLADLTPKTMVWVRFRALLRTGYTDWCNPESIIVT